MEAEAVGFVFPRAPLAKQKLYFIVSHVVQLNSSPLGSNSTASQQM